MRPRIILIFITTIYVNVAFAQCDSAFTSLPAFPIDTCGNITEGKLTITFTGPMGVVSWEYVYGDGTPPGVTQVASHTYQSYYKDTTYFGHLMTTCNTGLDTSYNYFSVTLRARPKVDFYPESNPICASQTLCFVNQSDSGAAFSYFWDFEDPPTDTTFEPCHSYSTVGAYDVELFVTNDSTGCVSKGDSTINVTLLPSPNFTISPSGCVPSRVLFTNTTLDTNIIDWIWNFGDPSTLADTSHNPDTVSWLYNNSGFFTASLIAVDTAGCGNTRTRQVQVIANPTSNFSIIPDTICAFIQAAYTYVGSGTSSATLNWDFDGGDTIGDTLFGTGLVLWDSLGLKTVELEVIENGCSSSFQKEVFVRDIPAVSMTSNVDSICDGEIAVFVASPPGLTLYNFYDFDSLIYISPTTNYSTISLPSGSQIYVIGVDTSGCASLPSDTATLIIKPKPVIDSLTRDGDSLICPNDTITFRGHPTGYQYYNFYNGFVLLQSGPFDTLALPNLTNGDSIWLRAFDNGCGGKATDTIGINAIVELFEPTVNCGTSTNTTVNIVWDTVPGAIGYTIDTGGVFVATVADTILNYWITGLAPGHAFDISVQALHLYPCGNSSFSVPITCSSIPCAAKDFDLVFVAEHCEGDSTVLMIENIQTLTDTFAISWRNGPWTLDSTFGLTVGPADTVIKVAVIDTASIQSACPAFTKYFRLTIYSIPVASIVSTASIYGDTVCSKEVIIFSNSVQGYDNYRFMLNGVSVQSSGNHNYITDSLNNGDSVYIIATNNGCSDTSSSITSTVITVPMPVLTSSDPNNIICAGDLVTFTANPNIYDSYEFLSWVVPVQDDTLNSYVTDSLTNGECILVFGTMAGHCISPSSDTICTIVRQIPTVNIGSSDVNLTFCAGDAAIISGSPGNWNQYMFYNGSNQLQDSTLSTLLIDSSNVQSGDSVYIIASHLGCFDTSSAIAHTIIYLPDISLSSSDTDICIGDPVVFTVTPDTYTLYEFFIDTILVQVGSSNVYTDFAGTLVDGNVISVNGINIFGDTCSRMAVNTLTITVNQLPIASLINDPLNDSLCQIDTFVFSGLPLGLGNYEFFVNSASQAIQDSSINTFRADSSVVANGDSVYVIVTDLSGCRSLPSNIRTVFRQTTPVGFVTVDDTTLCIGESTDLSASGGLTHQWLPIQGLDNSTIANPVGTPQTTTTYTYTTTSNGCTSKKVIFTIHVDEEPVVAYAGQNIEDWCVNTMLDLSATGGTTYIWYPTDNLSDPNIANPEFEYVFDLSDPLIDRSWTYTVMVQNVYCFDTASVTIILDKCLEDLTGLIPQIITPNGDGVNDVWELPDIDYFTESEIKIFSRWGNLVYQRQGYLNDWRGNNLKGKSIPDGTYFYVITLGNGTVPKTGFIMIHR
ncbi:MAG: gliding motility-associated C-terminal domain-containing protein [Bacteroidetes bacterium]|nr:gliding motility-associated C-terminal domain-containing protein [Bacteroidota bacterium]